MDCRDGSAPGTADRGRGGGILVVDDAPANLKLLVQALADLGERTRPVPSGGLALRAIESDPPDLVLLDADMPGMDGYEVCARLKADGRFRDIPVVFVSGCASEEQRLEAFAAGAVDFVGKPFHGAELRARVATHVRIGRLARELAARNRELERTAVRQARRVAEAHRATIFALARLFESRGQQAGTAWRMSRACETLALRLSRDGYRGRIDAAFVAAIGDAAPLHDIGNLGVPDSVLLKPGPLTAEEWAVVRTHPERGAAALESVLASHPESPVARMGAELARAHHERWDGSGYPRGLEGEEIPLSARVFTIADQYDALRSPRPHRPPLSHAEAVRVLTEGDGRTSPHHFDPRVLDAFVDGEAELEEAGRAACVPG